MPGRSLLGTPAIIASAACRLAGVPVRRGICNIPRCCAKATHPLRCVSVARPALTKAVRTLLAAGLAPRRRGGQPDCAEDQGGHRSGLRRSPRWGRGFCVFALLADGWPTKQPLPLARALRGLGHRAAPVGSPQLPPGRRRPTAKWRCRWLLAFKPRATASPAHPDPSSPARLPATCLRARRACPSVSRAQATCWRCSAASPAALHLAPRSGGQTRWGRPAASSRLQRCAWWGGLVAGLGWVGCWIW